ncbi:MAG: response regulator transcription factor [Thiolinea sp.]
MTHQQLFSLMLIDPDLYGAQTWNHELSKLQGTCPVTPVCMLSPVLAYEQVRQSFLSGIKGIVYKDADRDEILRAITTLLAGRIHFPGQLFKTETTAHRAYDPLLTKRQQEILLLIASGYSNKAIANQLVIAEGTVKRHVYNLFRVLGVRNRIEAIKAGKEQALI